MAANKSIIIIAFLLFTLLIRASAFSDYGQIGGLKSDFAGSSTLFNENYLSQFGVAAVYERALLPGGNKTIPLVADLDNDGIKEIIVNDRGTLKIYQNKNLNLISTLTIGSQNDRYAAPYIFDINGDSNPEILVGDESTKNISIINFSISSGTQLLSKIDLNFSIKNPEIMYYCIASEKCLAIVSENIAGATGTKVGLRAISFNSTFPGGSLNLKNSTSNGAWCFPHLRFGTITGNSLIFSSMDAVTTGNNINIFQVSRDSSNDAVPVLNLDFVISGNWQYGSPQNAEICPSNGGSIGRIFTSPLVMDAQPGGGNEIIIGYLTSTNVFRMSVYDSAGNFLANAPTSQTAEGIIISNPIKANAFPVDKTGLSDMQDDFCMVGFQQSTKLADVLCGSLVNTWGAFSLNNIEFFANFSQFNISESNTYLNYETLSHSVQADTEIIAYNNLDEILTSYGVIKLTNDECILEKGCGGCSLATQCNAEISYSTPVYNGIIIPVDYQDSGNSDLLALRSNALDYIDDKQSNEPPSICPSGSDCPFSPCQSFVWMLNTTFGITLKATDSNNDLIAYNMIMYYGNENQYELGWSDNFTSGTSKLFTTILNKSISAGKIRVYARDNNLPGTNIDYKEITFNVGDNGIEYGSCTSYIGGDAPEGGNVTITEGTGIQETSAGDNPISEATNKVARQFKLASSIIWITFMIVASGLVFYYGKKEYRELDIKTMGIILGALNFFLLYIGAKLNLISGSFIIIIIIIAVGAIVIHLRTATTAQ